MMPLSKSYVQEFAFRSSSLPLMQLQILVPEIVYAESLEFLCKLCLIDVYILPKVNLPCASDIAYRNLCKTWIIEVGEKCDAFVQLQQHKHDDLLIHNIVKLRDKASHAAVIHLYILHVVIEKNKKEVL